MDELVDFLVEITLSKAEVLDVVTALDEIAEQAEALGALEAVFGADGIKRLLLGRLMGDDGD